MEETKLKGRMKGRWYPGVRVPQRGRKGGVDSSRKKGEGFFVGKKLRQREKKNLHTLGISMSSPEGEKSRTAAIAKRCFLERFS